MDQITLPKGWEDWKIVESIGEGSYGTVYKASREMGNETVFSAIKIIRVPGSSAEGQSIRDEMGSIDSEKSYYQEMADTYIQEISAMNNLKGISNIVSVEDYAFVNNEDGPGWSLFIRMELLTGYFEYARNHTLNETDFIHLGIDICKALECCEKVGIVHRDIKPSNIFYSPLGGFKLGDFGVARKMDRTTGAYSFKGTFSFIAPEIMTGHPYSHLVDIYSLGLVLYRLCNSNRDPFLDVSKQMITSKEREEAISRRIAGEELPAPVNASPELAAVILKACAFLPEDRYQSANEFRAALENILYAGGGKPLISSKKRLIIAGGFVALCLIVLLIITLTSGNDSSRVSDDPSFISDRTEATDAPDGTILGAGGSGSPVFGQPSPSPETTAEVVDTPTPTPLQEDAKLVNISGTAGSAFCGRDATIWANYKKALERLTSNGCSLSYIDQSQFTVAYIDQFSFMNHERSERQVKNLTTGDHVILYYNPTDEFLDMLRKYGITLVFTPYDAEFSIMENNPAAIIDINK